MGSGGAKGSDGHSLIELAAVLLIGSVALSVGMPTVQAQRDRWSVEGAREAAVSLAALARHEAMTRGEATLSFDPASDRIWVESLDSVRGEVDVEAIFGVDLGPEGPARTVRFDALGLGRIANATLVLSRGRGRAGITLSAYGRVRRW